MQQSTKFRRPVFVSVLVLVAIIAATLVAAGAVMVALPTIVIYALFQRQFVRGVTAGAVKG